MYTILSIFLAILTSVCAESASQKLLGEYFLEAGKQLEAAQKASLNDPRSYGIVQQIGPITGNIETTFAESRANSSEFWHALRDKQLDNDWSITQALVSFNAVLVQELGTAMRRSLIADVLRVMHSSLVALQGRRSTCWTEAHRRSDIWLEMCTADARRLAAVANGDRSAVEPPKRYVVLTEQFRLLLHDEVAAFWTEDKAALSEFEHRLQSAVRFAQAYAAYLQSQGI